MASTSSRLTARPRPFGTAGTASRGPRGDADVYSQNQSDCAVFSFGGPAGHAATVIVMRKRGQVWLVFPDVNKTTVGMTAAQATHLIVAISVASGGPR